MSVSKSVKTVSDNKLAGPVFPNAPTLLSTAHTRSFTWLIVPINFVFYIAPIKLFHLLTTKTTNAPKDVPMALLPTILQNNVFPNVPLCQTIHLHKIHPIFACSNVLSVVTEARKICSVSQIVGGQITPTILLDFVFKHAPLDILPKTKLLDAT